MTLAGVLAARPALGVPGSHRLTTEDAQALLDSVITRRRVMASLAADELTDIARLSRDYPGLYEQLSNEIGCALTLGDAAAERLIELGRRLTDQLPVTLDLLRRGEIGVEHAAAMAAAIDGTNAEVAAVVDAAMAKVMTGLIPADIKDRARGRVLRRDHEAVKKRHEQAVKERTVERWGLGDGMAALRMTGPAEDIAETWHAITVVAAESRTPGDHRSFGNMRYDTLVDLCRHALVCGPTTSADRVGDATDANATSRPNLSRRAENRASATGPGRAIGELCAVTDAAGHGHIDDRDEGVGVTVTSGATGIDSSIGMDSSTGTDRSAGIGKTARRTERPWALVNVTVPYSVLTGGHEPGHIAGIGPITADQARQIILTNLARRVVTDPLSGSVLDVGRTRYRPSAAIADHVKVRDVTCVAYGCRRPAVECELDHGVPFTPGRRDGGVTSAASIRLHCKHHHRAKDGGGCRCERTERGFVWTTPLGRSYLKPPTDLYQADPDDPDDHWATQICPPHPPIAPSTGGVPDEPPPF